ncbi:MAG: LysR family transcriptional regulator [Oscillospiraceae bacterium]|nr:LysR family transcriptional regulator [Oscillospiraceae bacterium]
MSASFDAYKIFYFVGKFMNITHAASALFLSQSTVSRGIQNLETELGCRLFERTQHGVAFTAEGRVLYEHIARACESIFQGEEAVLRRQQTSRGHLRIGVGGFVFSQFVLPVIRDYRLDRPDVRFEIVSGGFGSYRGVNEALLDGRIDLACLSAASAEELTAPGVNVTPVASYEEILVASSGFPELTTGSYALSELSGYPFATLVSGTSAASRLDRLFRAVGIEVAPEFTADSIDMFLSILRTCPCLAPVPAICRKEFTGDGRMFEVRLKTPLPGSNIVLMTAKAAPQDSAQEAFIRQLRRYIRLKIHAANEPD